MGVDRGPTRPYSLER